MPGTLSRPPNRPAATALPARDGRGRFWHDRSSMSSAHATLTEIEQEARAFCRRRFRDQAEYLEAKDAHCKRILALVSKGRR